MPVHELRRINTNGVTLEVVVAGAGPLVILLHGWPQCWYLWRHQIDPIVNAGFRVAVPNQRGYGGSSAPREIEAYNVRELAADVVGLAQALGYDEFNLIGHDWGCVVAWNTALLHDDSCTAIMGLSIPFWRFDPDFTNPPQDGFWYARLFQTPGLAEADLETYVGEYRKSGFHGPNSWYRNIPTHDANTADIANKRFRRPAAFAAGSKDVALMLDPDWRVKFEPWFDDLRFVEIVDGAGHWVQMEKPAETTAAILRFLHSLG